MTTFDLSLVAYLTGLVSPLKKRGGWDTERGEGGLIQAKEVEKLTLTFILGDLAGGGRGLNESRPLSHNSIIIFLNRHS